MKKELLTIYLKGMCMGIADIIPGVSGGTIALITGIYDRLITGISNINIRFIPYLLKKEYGEAKKNIDKIDFKLFIPLILGIGTSFLIMSNLIHYLLENYVAITYSFFFGLILASALILFKEVKKISIKIIPIFIVGFLFAFFVVGSEYIQLGHSFPILFASGALAICAMILPGISGAFILLFLNQYSYIISLINGLEIAELLVFGAGGAVGLFSFSRILSYILHNHRSATMLFLTGLMLGALRFPYQNIAENINSANPLFLGLSLICGFLIVMIMEGGFMVNRQ